MELITWYKKYSVKNEELDKHHQELFNLINDLHANYKNNDIASNLIEKIILLSKMHILKEEEYIKLKGCEDIEEHLYFNRAIIDKLLELQQTVHNEDYVRTKELTAYIAYWVLNHVMEEDKKLVQ